MLQKFHFTPRATDAASRPPLAQPGAIVARQRVITVMAGWTLALVAGMLTGCSESGLSHLSEPARLGELIFNDVSLSASGRQSCASCHAEAQGHAQPNDLSAQLGGPNLTLQGDRTSPSLRYLATNTAFHFDAEGTAVGGFFWDGRAASLEQQAQGPFLNPVEMANTSAADVVAKLAKASYAPAFAQQYGARIFDQPDAAFLAMAQSLERFQLEDPKFRPYTSKYDAVLRGQDQLSVQEQRGLALFKDPAKGNCASCHPADKGADGSLPLFTDFSYDNLGVPRNPDLQHNADPAFFDLGLCARSGGDMAGHPELCGAFKVPSLRNVAVRQAYFHNGRFKSLKDVLTFYVQRDTNPDKWYSRNADGSVHRYDDLPAAYVGNVNTTEVPYNRHPGDAPALSDAEIDDVLAFLRTLNDADVH